MTVASARVNDTHTIFSTLRKEIDIKERPAGRGKSAEGWKGREGREEKKVKRWREIEIAGTCGTESIETGEGNVEKKSGGEGGETYAGGKIERFTCTRFHN